ncbi:hypothetical protein KKG31_03800 [Patescibacteria group bacterium]|nr:hypothetical protein [Patescibacteria group bacterium]MBU1758267.1 hypothetical protein [Patescibacteria group bacterium]
MYGTFPDEMYDVSLVISGTTYPTTGDGTGKWKSLPLSPALADGVYDVTLNYTNIYTKTGSRTYTSGLTIDLDGPYVEYNPSTFTT